MYNYVTVIILFDDLNNNGFYKLSNYSILILKKLINLSYITIRKKLFLFLLNKNISIL